MVLVSAVSSAKCNELMMMLKEVAAILADHREVVALGAQRAHGYFTASMISISFWSRSLTRSESSTPLASALAVR